MATKTNSLPTERDRESSPVQVSTALIRKLRVITAHRGMTQADFLQPIISGPIEREYRKVVAEMNDAGEAGA